MRNNLKVIENLLLLGLLITTLLITPMFSYDPFNIPKFSAMIIFSILIFLNLAVNRYQWQGQFDKVLILVIGFFLIWALLSSLISSKNLTENFYGATGRQTGFFAYLSFLIIFVTSILISNLVFLYKVIKLLAFCGIVSGIYGLFQGINLDIVNWINPYSSVIGFLGNPNFQSSFLGIAIVGLFALVNKNNPINSILIFFLIIFLCYVVNLTQARQGYLVIATGIFTNIFFRIKNSKKFSRFSYYYTSLIIVLIIAVVLDMLQRSPWNSIIYKETVSYRGDFWRSASRILLANPVFGVGFDGFRDNYRLYKDSTAALRPLPDAEVDSAHNVFLDIALGGGFPLLFAYLILVFFTFRAAFRLHQTGNFNFGISGVFSCWLAYLAQSMISMNNIGLAIWGWSLSGLVIGYEINTRKNRPKFEGKKPVNLFLTNFVGLIIGLVLVTPQFIVDAQFKSAVESKDYSKIYKNALKWPQSVKRITLISNDLRLAGFPEQSKELIIQALKLNPNNFEAWLTFARLPNISSSELEIALINLRKLDPLNPGLK